MRKPLFAALCLLLAGAVSPAFAGSWPLTSDAGAGTAQPHAQTADAGLVLNGKIDLTGFQGGVERPASVYIDNGTRFIFVRRDGFHAARRAAGFAAAGISAGFRR